MGKIQLQGWRSTRTVTVDPVERRDSQIGQLLFYLLAIQLRRIQLHYTSSDGGLPSPLLGVFVEQGKVCSFYYERGHLAPCYLICAHTNIHTHMLLLSHTLLRSLRW